MNEGTTVVSRSLTDKDRHDSLRQIDPVSSGFTAVNGNRHRSPSKCLEEPSQPTTTIPVRQVSASTSRDHDTTPAQYPGWRADDRRLSEQTADSPPDKRIDSGKRKRSDGTDVERESDVRADQPYGTGPASPKRRVTAEDPVDDLESRDQPSTASAAYPPERRLTESTSVGAYQRQPSPVHRRGVGKPVPLPRPEIVANLAESLARELSTAAEAQAVSHTVSQTSAHTHAVTESEGSPRDEDEDQQLANYSAEQTQGQESSDSKKRKRIFSTRTKTGCHTCRTRKKKCDEGKPTCRNCSRGGFPCGGYGAKPVDLKPSGPSSRAAPIALQSKPSYYEPPHHGPTGYYHNPMDEGPRYSHWGNIVTEPEQSQSQSQQSSSDGQAGRRDGWSRPGWAPNAAPHPYMPERMPPTDFNSMPPMQLYAPNLPLPPPPPPPPLDAPNLPLPPPPPAPLLDSPWLDPSYRPMTGYGTLPGIRHNASGSILQRNAALAFAHNPKVRLSEKEKMLIGQPFLHFIDDVLLNDRQQCRGALERYNDAARTSSCISPEERGRLFRAIMDPPTRPSFQKGHAGQYSGPTGTVGHQSIVECPFNCEYGYNIRLGSFVVIQSGCYMQDACEISIGDRTIIGPNVKFYGITASVDSKARKGSQGTVQGGPIKIAEDCFIGGNVTILPFRKIGRGAVVGACSVVTKDVKEFTVVAGNPAKVLRRIEPGSNVDQHHPDIQEQNDRMYKEMLEEATRSGDN